MTQDKDTWKRVIARRFIELFKDAENISEFDSNLYYSTVEKITVNDAKKVIVSLLDGTDIECEIK